MAMQQKSLLMKEQQKEELIEEPIKLIKVSELFKKGNRIELEKLKQIAVAPILTKKEIKNASIVKNLISSVEERFLCLVDFNSSYSATPDNQTTTKVSDSSQPDIRLVVLKKWSTQGTEAKKLLQKTAFSLYSQTKN